MYKTLYQYTQLVDLFGNKYFFADRPWFIDTGFTINDDHITPRIIVDLVK